MRILETTVWYAVGGQIWEGIAHSMLPVCPQDAAVVMEAVLHDLRAHQVKHWLSTADIHCLELCTMPVQVLDKPGVKVEWPTRLKNGLGYKPVTWSSISSDGWGGEHGG